MHVKPPEIEIPPGQGIFGCRYLHVRSYGALDHVLFTVDGNLHCAVGPVHMVGTVAEFDSVIIARSEAGQLHVRRLPAPVKSRLPVQSPEGNKWN